MRATYTLADNGALEALREENVRLRETLDRMEHFRSSAETALAMAEERERATVVAWLRAQRVYGTDELLGQGWANVCNILADQIENGMHRFSKPS
jgi:hypothetical protein